MEVSFEGICLWESKSKAPGLLGILRDASAGETINGVAIPPHTACVIVRSDSVDDSQWNEPPNPIVFRGIPHSLYPLDGDQISFDPVPAGGAPNIADLSRAICATANKVVDPVLMAVPPAAGAVAAHIDIPGTARLSIVRNTFGAKMALLLVADGTKLVSTRSDGSVRRLSFDPNTRVTVANVDIPLALSDPSTAPPDDDHARLYCPMFVDPNAAPALAQPAIALSLSARAAENRRPRPRPRPRAILGDFLTLGAGCSNTQYP